MMGYGLDDGRGVWGFHSVYASMYLHSIIGREYWVYRYMSKDYV